MCKLRKIAQAETNKHPEGEVAAGHGIGGATHRQGVAASPRTACGHDQPTQSPVFGKSGNSRGEANAWEALLSAT